MTLIWELVHGDHRAYRCYGTEVQGWGSEMLYSMREMYAKNLTEGLDDLEWSGRQYTENEDEGT